MQKVASIGRTTVSEYLRRAKEADLSWPLPEGMDEAGLDRLLFPSAPPIPSGARSEPDWTKIHQERKRKGVTLFLLWQEYKESQPEGYQYSAFCKKYRQWTGNLDLVMRQEHRAGEKMFVDYAGQTAEVVDSTTGEIRQAQIFVAVLGASNYTYAEASWTQSLPDWIGSHSRAFAFFGGVPEIVVPDNLKTGVKRACYYEPDLNPSYQEMATHYGCAVIPARVRKPRTRQRLRQLCKWWNGGYWQDFAMSPSLAFMNSIAPSVNWSQKSMNELSKNCQDPARPSFKTWIGPLLNPFLPIPMSMRSGRRARVHIDYHVEVKGYYYSAPYQLVKQQVDVRITANTVEIFHKGRRVASHPRSCQGNRHNTLNEHMPKPHQSYADWTPQRLIRWAAKTGPSTAQVIESILASRPHPQQGFRSCLGIMRLGKDYGEKRLEAACDRALAIGGRSFKSIQAILKTGLDQLTITKKSTGPPTHTAHQHPGGSILQIIERRLNMLVHPTLDKLNTQVYRYGASSGGADGDCRH